ncbi:MAG: hypothetical protein D6677_11780 [Calditrichaeota bacterium]|nr:MAG: hypothetical protein D6677_11780 [Calditrichota bacterium]
MEKAHHQLKLELDSLTELSQTLNATLETDAIINQVLLVPMGRLMISRAAVYLKKDDDTATLSTSKGRFRADLPHTLEIPKHLPADWEMAHFPELKQSGLEIALPVMMDKQVFGMVFYGAKLTGQAFESHERRYLQTIVNLAAPAMQNARRYAQLKKVNADLDRKIQELHTLFEIGGELNKTFEADDVLKRFAFALMGQMFVNQFLVILGDENGTRPQAVYKQGRLFTDTLIQQLLENASTLHGAEQKLPAHLSLCVPMYIQQNWKGALILGPKMNGAPYTDSDKDFLTTLANVLIAALENTRLFQDKLVRMRMEEELATARQIQARLLPGDMPRIAGYEMHGLNIPSKQVGGDYFDIIPITDTEYLLTIADVSGKGMPAALLVSNLQAGLHILKNEKDDLTEITARLNDLIYQNTSVEKYITFFIARLNTATHTLTYVNAGHNPPYLFRTDGACLELDKGGLILGMMPGIGYESATLDFNAGDCLVLFTDGVTEAMDENETPFDEFRVIRFFEENFRKKSTEVLNTQLVEALYSHAGDPTEDDDITILTVKRLS